MIMEWRPLRAEDIREMAGCAVVDGAATFYIPEEGEVDDPNSGTYYLAFIQNTLFRVVPVSASVQPFAGVPPENIFGPARIAGYQTTDEAINEIYTGTAPLVSPLSGWVGQALETTASYLDFHGATTGGQYNTQSASFSVEVYADKGDGEEPPPTGCFWTDLVNATQQCTTEPQPEGVFIDFKVHYTCDAYEGTGVNLCMSEGINGAPGVLDNPEPRLLAYWPLDAEPSTSEPLPGVSSVADFIPLVGESMKFGHYGGGWLNVSKYALEASASDLIPGKWFAANVYYWLPGASGAKTSVIVFRVKANDGSWPSCE